MFSFICVYNDDEILDKYLKNSVKKLKGDYELILIDNRQDQFSSCASALNHGAKSAKGDYLVFLHQDINFTDENWIDNTLNQINKLDNPGIIGVAGKIDKKHKGNNNHYKIYSNIKDGLNPTDASPYKLEKAEIASTVDECLFIIPKKVFDLYQFDEVVCDNWHLYGVDYTYSIKNKGYLAYIIPSVLEHRSGGYSMSDDYFKTLKNLQKKHEDEKVIYTCMGDWIRVLPVSCHKLFYSIVSKIT